MNPETPNDQSAALLTHTHRFSLLVTRLGEWAKGWTFSVSVLVAAIPGAASALEHDMQAFVNILEELRETVIDLACDYVALEQTLANEERKNLSDGGPV